MSNGATERCVEVPWAESRLANVPPGKALEVGYDGQDRELLTGMLASGWKLWIVDLRPVDFPGPAVKVQADIAADTGMPSGFFDAILCISTLEHIGEDNYHLPQFENGPALALAEMRRLLAPGGRLLLTAPVGKAGRYPWTHGNWTAKLFGVDEWAAQAQEAGFLVCDERYYRLVGDDYVECYASDLVDEEYRGYRSGGVGMLELSLVPPWERRRAERAALLAAEVEELVPF